MLASLELRMTYQVTNLKDNSNPKHKYKRKKIEHMYY